MNTFSKIFKPVTVLVLLVSLALILRVFFLAQCLEDWDSIQLALGLHQYSIINHQPHPPGYPIYILMGRLFLSVFKNDTLALTWMSAVFGSLTVVPLYLLLKKIFNQNWALIGSIMFIFTPVVWLLSVTALTDIVGLFFLILVGSLIFKFQDQPKAMITISLLAGLVIGVRFNEFPVLMVLLIWVIYKQKNFKLVILQLTSFFLGVSLWLVPIIFLTGWDNFFKSFSETGSYVLGHDLLLGNSHTILGLIKAKVMMLAQLFSLGFSPLLSLVFLICLVWTLTQKKLYSQNWYQFCLIWLGSYFLLLLTFYNLELPRHILPLIIPILLITTFCLINLIKRNKLFLAVPGLLFLALVSQSYSQAQRFHNSLPATIGPVLYVKQNFDPKETIVYASYTFRNFSYYAPEFISLDKNSDKSVITKDKTVITDLVDLNNDPALKNFREVETKYFTSDKDIFPKINSIQLHVLKSKQL